MNTPASKESTYSSPVWVPALFVILIATILFLAGYIMLQKKTKEEAAMSEAPTKALKEKTDVSSSEEWMTYTNEQAGFRLKYPPTVLFNQEAKGAVDSVLTISVDVLDAIPEDMPLGMDRKTALTDKEALAKGQATTVGDFAASDALVRIGNTYNGRLTSVLSRFEVCSVIFERTLVFYPNNYRVVIGLIGNKERIKLSMPEFFTIDQTNCGQEKVWNRDTMGTLIPTLAKGLGSGAAQEWYDTFTAIMKTIELISTTTTSGYPPSITPTSSCDISDSGLCAILSSLKNAMAARNYAGVLSYQKIDSITCDPDGMYMAICEGQPRGTVKEGYLIGYYQSEGAIVTKENYAVTLAGFIGSEAFTYHGGVVGAEKALLVFLNPGKTKMVAFPFIRSGATWEMNVTILGNLHPGSDYISLPQSILETF